MKKAFLRPSLLCFSAPAALPILVLVLMVCTGKTSARPGQSAPFLTHSAPFASWIGKKFIFLPDFRKQDYDSFAVVRANGKSVRQFGDGDVLYYSKFAEKTIICIAARPGRLVFHVPDYNIDIAYSLVSYTDGQRDHELLDFVYPLAPLNEIEAVRREYLGKTVWVNNSSRGTNKNLPWLYDAVKKNIIQKFTNNRLQRVDLPPGTPLVVTDVRWGNEILRPVRLVVRDSAGHFFCYEVAADRTNKSLPAGTPLDTADRCFSTWPSTFQ